jgi:hypothetical protein
MLIAISDQRPAILPWFCYAGWRSSFAIWNGTQATSPWTRATGTLPVIVQSPECCWTNFRPGTILDYALMRAGKGSHPICA